MKTEKIVQILVLIIVITFIVVVLGAVSLTNKLSEKNDLITALTSEKKVWRDRDSLEHVKVVAFTTQSAKDFLKLQTKDSTIKSLQETVKEYKSKLKNQGSVTNFSTNTNINSSGITQVISKDSIHQGLITLVYPKYVYLFNLKDKNNFSWITGITESTKDSTYITILVKNSYSIIVGQESKGLFKKSISYAEVKNYNPYSENTSMITYQVSLPKTKHFGVGPFIGYGVTDNFKFQPCLGVSLQYSIIKF